MPFLGPDLAAAIDGKRSTAALILAAGNSTRMGTKISKQFLTVGGIPVLAHTLMAYEKAQTITQIVVSARKQDLKTVQKIAKEYNISKLTHIVSGGKNRMESAMNAISYIREDIRYVAIADGARCLITPEEIVRVCSKAYSTNAASAGIPVAGTLKQSDLTATIKGTLSRTDVWEAQTPQVFHVSLYLAAMQRAQIDNLDVTDDNSLVEHLGYRVSLVPCSPENLKITTPDDLHMARAIYAYRKALQKDRNGGKK